MSISDFTQRQQAIDPHHSYLVQAPAGSGKTELLTDRILVLLSQVNRPEDILAITFTRKAAAEMRERILRKLQRGRSDTPPAQAHEQQAWELARQVLQRDRQQNWNLLENPNRLRIKTFDAFCQSIVRLTPSLSGTGASPQISENSQELYAQAVEITLNRIDQEPSIRYLLNHLDLNFNNTQSLLTNMLSKRELWLGLLDNLPQALVEMAQALEAMVEQTLMQAHAVMPADWSAFAPAVMEATHALSESKEMAALIDWDGQPFGVNFEHAPQWKALATFLFTKDKMVLRKQMDKRNGVAPGKNKLSIVQWLSDNKDNQALIHGLYPCTGIPTDILSEQKLQDLEQFFTCLGILHQQLQQVFLQEQALDFIEISRRASLALGQSDSPSDLLLKLDASLSHILIDEFQDTNYTQIDLIQKITSGWQSGDGRTLFLVGDPMQSIYRFRKAEVGIFLTVAEQQKLGDVDLIYLQLKENFRSSQGMVEWVNQVFTPIFPSINVPNLGMIKYSPSTPFHGKTQRPAVQTYGIDWGADTGLNKDLAQRKAEKILVQVVRNALAEHPDSPHPVAILVRGRNHLGEVAILLQRNNVPLRAVDIVALQNTEEVSDLVQLIRVMAHPGDRLAWLSLLRSPLCGLTLKSLTLLFEHERHSTVAQIVRMALWPTNDQDAEVPMLTLEERIGDEQASRLRHVVEVLLHTPYRETDLSYSAYIEALWQRLGGCLVYNSAAAVDNIDTVLGLIDSLAPYGELDLQQFEAQLESLFATPNEQGRAVQIMTMHKAKGLEFNEVIIFGLEKKPPGEKTDLLEFETSEEGSLIIGTVGHKASKTQDSVTELIRLRNKTRLEEEMKRLLYVACTRAKQHLHLFYLNEGKSPAANSMLNVLFPHLHKDIQVPALPLEQLQQSVTLGLSVLSYDKSVIRRLPASVIQSLATEACLNDKEPALSPERNAWTFEDHLPAAIGTVVHEWLEVMGRDRLQGWDSERILNGVTLIRRQLSQKGVAIAYLGSASQTVIRLLLTMFNDPKGQELLTHSGAQQEWHLYNEAGVEKVIDLVILRENDWWVVDYKTSLRGVQESQMEFIERLRSEYVSQLNLYAQYLQGYDDKPVKSFLYALDGALWIEI